MSRALARVPLYLVLLLVGAFVLVPIYVMVLTSLKPPAEAIISRMWDPPPALSFAAWERSWSTLRPYLMNSFRLAIPATVLSAFVGSVNG